MPPRLKYKWGFTGTAKQVLLLREKKVPQQDIEAYVELSKSAISKILRIYLTSIGETPDSGHLEVKNKAIELVKKLDADDISLHNADLELVAFIRQHTGKEKTTYRLAKGAVNPDQQLTSYKRIVGQLEGICYGLDSMPDVIHSSITPAQRADIERRLADCRRIIERRINLFRKDKNAEADNQEG